MRPEAEAFMLGAIWALEHPDATAEELKEWAFKQWPPFTPPTEEEIKLGKRRTIPE